MGKRVIAGVLAVAGLFFLVGLALYLLNTVFPQFRVIGAKEKVLLITPRGDTEVEAKIDTGAGYSSIDEVYARALGLVPDETEKVRIITDSGEVMRATIRLRFIIGNREVSSIATVADRTNFETRLLIGRFDLEGFVVDPSREFMSPPERTFFRFFGLTAMADNIVARVIIVIPILSAVVVFLRLIIGVHTYGIFAPTIVAVSLLDIGIFPGIIIYIILLGIGIATKIMVLGRLRLARIAEFSLVMFLLVVLMSAISLLPVGFAVSFTAVFFPLIITSHLIEQSARSIEEHTMRDALFILTGTLVVASVLAALGRFLIHQSFTTLWIVFAISIVVSISCGAYLGLRVSEFLRFKFLRRTHVHE